MYIVEHNFCMQCNNSTMLTEKSAVDSCVCKCNELSRCTTLSRASGEARCDCNAIWMYLIIEGLESHRDARYASERMRF